MAVPESTPPARVAHNNMRMLAQTVVQGDGVHRAVVGRFRSPTSSDVLLAKETSLVLASANDEGDLTTHHTQPVHATILNLQVLHAKQQTDGAQEVDKLVMLTTSGNLSIIQFDPNLHRFVSLSQMPLVPAGRPGLLPPQSLCVAQQGQVIAISGYNWVAMLLMSNVSQTPLHMPPVVAVLPSFLSTSTHTPRQHPPAPPTAPAPDTPAATPAPAPTPAAASPTRAFTSDEAWLRAQTDSRRLDAMWMEAELNTIPDLMRDQEDHLSTACPSVLMSMPPSGLIRSICFVETAGSKEGLALAVLYYVAPEPGFTLDILQWAPPDVTLQVKHRLQLHEMADMFDFLLGNLVLDMCPVRHCHSGLVLLYETGLVLFDLADIAAGGPNMPTSAIIHHNRVRCHSFANGRGQSSISSVGVIYGCKWPATPHVPSNTAPGPGANSTPASADSERQHEGESDLFGAQAAPRLLASFCWREERPPAFPASPDSRPANLHQELLLGFDVCQGFDHSVLSMVVEKIAPREGQGPGWSAVLQDTSFSPVSTPTTMLSLPNNHVLMGCEVGDGCIARLPTPVPGGSSRGPHATWPSVSSTLHNAAPVWAFTVANLQQLPQDQVYAACGSSSNGSIRVIQADQTVEVLYESGTDYPGISGMWSIPPWPGADFHSLLVLSFASGSRAMATGSTLRDVTDAVGLVPNERTLASACVGDRLLVQVMHKRMQLFSMDAALAQDQGELSCSPSGDRSRARLGEPLTLEDLEISTPDDLMPRQPEEEDGSGWSHATSPPVPTPGSSCPTGSTNIPHQGPSHVLQCGDDVWMPAGGASISTAAAADNVVVASCTHFKGLVAVQAVLADEGSMARPWAAGGVAQSPGKRKRARRRWCLQEMAHVALEDEVSCIHLLPYPQGGRGCKLVAAGTYKPGLQLLIWRPNDPHQGRSSFLPFASVAVTTLMRQSLRGGIAAPEKPPGSPRKALPDQAIPESVQILPLQSKHDDIQVLLGLRNGTMIQLKASHIRSASDIAYSHPFQQPILPPQAPNPMAPQLQPQSPQLELATTKHLGSLPVVLIPLPTAVGLVGTSLALSDRMALVSSAPGTGRAVASPLAVAGVTHAVPLWQPATSVTGATNSRFTVLCASSSGRLQLLDLQHQEHPHMRTLPLLPPARPVHLAVHPTKAVLVVACQGSDKLWEMRCIHPVSGATMARYPLHAGECVTGICMWQRPPQPASHMHSSRAIPHLGRAKEDGEGSIPAGVAAQQLGDQAEEEAEQMVAMIAEVPQREEEEMVTCVADRDEGTATGTARFGAGEQEEEEAESANQAEEEDVYVLVGTGEAAKPSNWSPCKGRLLMIQLAKSGSTQNGIWFNTVAESKFADQVHAVTVLPGCAPKAGLGPEGVVVAAVGRRLVAFSERQGHLRKHHLTATAQPVTCLSPGSSSGHFVASNEMDSVMAYDFQADSGFRMIHADRHSRPISHCSAVQTPVPSQATVAAVDQKGKALFLASEPETFGPERNMYMAVQYYLGQAPAGIVEGNLRRHPRNDSGDAEPDQLAPSSSSASACQDDFCLSSSALPGCRADSTGMGGAAEGRGEGFAGSAVDPPQPTGRPQGMPSGLRHLRGSGQQADKGQKAGSHSWVTVTTAGDVVQLTTVTEAQHQLLADLQHVMVKLTTSAPLSGCDLRQYRAARDSLRPEVMHLAKGPHTALDGDVLCHFLYLPAILQQQLLSAMLAAQAARQTCEGNPNSHMPVSLSDLVRVLESTLPVC